MNRRVSGRSTSPYSNVSNPDSAFIYRRSIATGTWELVHIQSHTILRAISSVGDTLIVVGDSTVLVSFNGGQTWFDRGPSRSSRGPVAYAWMQFWAQYSARDVQLGGLAGQGVIRSTDFYNTWALANQGMHNTHIVARPLMWGDKMLISTQFNGRWKYDFTAGSWSPTGDGLPIDVVSSLASDNTYMYAGTVNNGLWRSSDWGTTFSQNLFGTNATGFAVTYTSPTIAGFVLAGGRGERLWKSTDSGDTWSSSLLPGSPYSIVGIQAVSQNEIFVATGNFGGYGGGNGVYKTTNGGTSFTHHGLQLTSCITFDRSGTNLMTGTALDQIWEGTVGATTWNPTGSFGGFRLRDAMFYSHQGQPVREIAATSGGLCEREAFSQDPWVKRALGGFEISRLEYVRIGSAATFQGQIMAGTYGGGMYRSTSPLTSVGEKTGVTLAFALGQNYPNPFNPSTRIPYSVHVSGFTSLKVYDLLGREVATLVNEAKAPGAYEVTWNAEGIASGVYFCKLQAGGFVQTRKMLLAR